MAFQALGRVIATRGALHAFRPRVQLAVPALFGSQGPLRLLSTPPQGGDDGGSSKPVDPAKKKRDLQRAYTVENYGHLLQATDLRPQIADNVEEILRQAAEAIPPAAGPRRSRRKKRQRLRLQAIRAQDRVRKLQGIKKHEREMERRSAAGVQARLAKLGITSFVPKKAASSTTSTTAKA